jgi:signal transduction histidine kinase
LGLFDYTVILLAAALFALLLTLMLAVLSAREGKRKKSRIANLTAYLRNMNDGDYTLRPDIQEDELSPLEDELYKTVVLLREGREIAQKEKERMADNLSDIAHQLKTPLASISLMSDLLEGGLSEKQTEYARQISAQTERLNTLVSSLLALSRLDAGTLALEQKPVDVPELFLSVREALLPLLERKNQTLSFGENDAAYCGDFNWSTQAFINIIKIASEHSPNDKGITVQWEENPVCTAITIGDDGFGIPTEDLPNLFTRFYRGKNAAKDRAGIGLSLAKALIEGQNGEITAGNRPEGGAVFTVKFYHGV